MAARQMKRLATTLCSSSSSKPTIISPLVSRRGSHIRNLPDLFATDSVFDRRNFSSSSSSVPDYNSKLEEYVGRDLFEFQKWCNGGGTFHKTAHIDPSAFVEIGAVVHSKVFVGANVRIASRTVVGPEVIIGQSTRIGYNVALTNCTIGDSCVIHNGVCIGQDGFGFFIDEQGKMVKKPQVLKVKIGNEVEIGANSCIDRGSWRDTIIGDHSKIDNLVQIGHNAVIGKHCMLCGQVGIAGSVTMGDYVTLGGRVGVRDHVSIVSKVRLAGNSCVTKDISVPGDYGGVPAVPIHEWRRQVASSRLTSRQWTSKIFREANQDVVQSDMCIDLP